MHENETRKASPLASTRESARVASQALAAYAEGVEGIGDDTSIYAWLDAHAHTIRASAIDLGAL
jgi:hypothetical protein